MTGQSTSDAFAGKLAFFGYDAKGFKGFPAVRKAIRRHAPAALKTLYGHIRATPEAREFFKSEASMTHASDKQLEHWLALFSRPLDDTYHARAEGIGNVHARIGLSPTWYIGGYARVLEDMIRRIRRPSLRHPFGGSTRTVTTLVKAALLDMDVALSAYFIAEQAGRKAVIVEVGNVLDQLANGNFTATLKGLPPGYEALVADFDAMRQRMSETLAQVANAAGSIDTGAGEIDAATQDFSGRTEQQAASLAETAAAMAEITVTVRATAQQAGDVARSVRDAQKDADEGGAIVGQAVDAMHGIERSSMEIAQIIAVIDGIAFQTNLLALNAGVEAARAGDAGRGFAVVASEVRALAQRSADAAKDIKELITGSSREVTTGVELVAESGKALSRIAERVTGIAGLVDTISRSSDHQASGLTQINTAVSEMDRMTQQNAAMVEQSTAAAHELKTRSRELAQLVGKFQLGTPVVTPSADVRRRPPAPVRLIQRSNLAVAAHDEEWSDF